MALSMWFRKFVSYIYGVLNNYYIIENTYKARDIQINGYNYKRVLYTKL